jgi:hypothetical protein
MKTGKVTGIAEAREYPGYSMVTVRHPEIKKKKAKKGSKDAPFESSYGRESRVMVPNETARPITIGDEVEIVLERLTAKKDAARKKIAALDEEYGDRS